MRSQLEEQVYFNIKIVFIFFFTDILLFPKRHGYDEIIENLKLNHQACKEEESRRRQQDTNKIIELTKKIQRMENVFRENTKGRFLSYLFF